MKRTKIFRLMAVILVFAMFLTATPVYAAKDGGWSGSKARYSFLSSGQKKIFNKAVKKLRGVTYKPVALVAKQTVSGTNYVFLCQGTTVTPKPKRAWYILTAYQSLAKKVKLISLNKLKVAAIQTNEDPRTGSVPGGLTICGVKNKPSALSSSVRKIYKKGIQRYVGYELRPIALLGTQVVSGKYYRFLCYGKAKAGKDIFVVDIYRSPSGNCKMVNLAPLNLEYYVGS